MKKRTLKKAVLSIMGLAVITGLVGCTGSGKKEAKDGKTIIVGLDNTFVPMGFVDKNGELTGFDVDLAKEAFKRMGYTPKFQNIDWSMKEQSLDNKNVDCLWNGYSITEKRKEKVAFSEPYLKNEQIAITLAKNPYKKLEDLKNQSVGTQTASSSYDAIEKDKDFLNIIKDKTPVTYDTFDKALRDLEIGRTKAVVGDEVLLKYYMKQRGVSKYRVLDGNLGTEEYGVGFRKSDEKLVKELNKTLNEMKKDGSFEKIKKKWFN